MQQNDKYSGLSWMTEELKSQLILRDKIVLEQDFDSLFQLKDNSDFSIALHEILINKYEKSLEKLNSTELNLFLCMHIENAGQADSILSFLQEWYSQYSKEVVNALNEIGAVKSSEVIRQAVELLPRDGSWFFDSSDEKTESLMEKMDREFSSYPDGLLKDLYRNYAENNKSEILINRT